MKTQRLDFVQALRGIAALAVVLCHARYFLADTPSWDFAQRYLLWGAGGADLFFIISGFIMVYTTRASDGSPADVRKFAAKRFAKIWPTYAVITVAWIFIDRGGWPYLHQNVAHFVRSLLFLPMDSSKPMYFGSELTTLQLGWTLNYEAYFYVVFGISMLLKKWRWYALGAWMLTFLVIVPEVAGVLSIDPMAPTGFRSAYLSMMTNPIIWDFIVGMVIAGIYLSPVSFPSARSAWLAVISAFTVCAWGYAANLGPNEGLLGWGAYATIIMLTLAIASKTIDFKVPSGLVALGNVSFTLYLTHFIVINFAFRILRAIGRLDLIHTWAHVILCTGFAIVFAMIVSPWLEIRLHDATLAFLTKRRRVTQGPALSKL